MTATITDRIMALGSAAGTMGFFGSRDLERRLLERATAIILLLPTEEQAGHMERLKNMHKLYKGIPST